ncbi:MAG: FAD-dependent oxidoreductase [Bdellovibrionota bacterium]
MSIIYDYIVIGAGFTGLQIALQLKNEGAQIALLDNQEQPGGSHRSGSGPLGSFDRGFRFYPASDIAEQVLHEIESTMGYSQIYSIKENSPITFSTNEFKDFLGFGEETPYAYDLMRPFLTDKRCELSKPFNEIIFDYQNKLGDVFHPRSMVTKINFESDAVNVIVNGSKTFKARQVVYAAHIKDLLPLVPAEFLPSKFRQRLGKAHVVTAICLDLLHDQVVSERENLHVLQGNQKEELVPCFGLFQRPFEKDGKMVQLSQWMIFIPRNQSEEPEETVSLLKHLKRQIKRAYPNALDQVSAERIFVPECMGLSETLKSQGELVKGQDERLWVASPELNNFPQLLGSTLQSRWILSHLGFYSGSLAQGPLEPDSSHIETEINL